MWRLASPPGFHAGDIKLERHITRTRTSLIDVAYPVSPGSPNGDPAPRRSLTRALESGASTRRRLSHEPLPTCLPPTTASAYNDDWFARPANPAGSPEPPSPRPTGN